MTQLLKLFLCCFAGIGLFASLASARPPEPERQVARMQEKLDLSDEQAETILDILENALINCDNAESREDHRQCMEDQKGDVKVQISSVLTDEQLEEFEQHHSQGPGGINNDDSEDDLRQSCRKFRRKRNKNRGGGN